MDTCAIGILAYAFARKQTMKAGASAPAFSSFQARLRIRRSGPPVGPHAAENWIHPICRQMMRREDWRMMKWKGKERPAPGEMSLPPGGPAGWTTGWTAQMTWRANGARHLDAPIGPGMGLRPCAEDHGALPLLGLAHISGKKGRQRSGAARRPTAIGERRCAGRPSLSDGGQDRYRRANPARPTGPGRSDPLLRSPRDRR